nr:MAG TPA: hypothetical protein [Caudoviricetes sp.]
MGTSGGGRSCWACSLIAAGLLSSFFILLN